MKTMAVPPRIVIVGTNPHSGQGGISTALQGYLAGFQDLGVEAAVIVSHGKSGRLSDFIRSVSSVWRTGGRDAVFWLHCGPWLSMLRKGVLALVARGTGGRVVLHLHSPTLRDYSTNFIGRRLIGLLFRLADGVIVLTPWWERFVLEHYPQLRGRLAVAPNPVVDASVNMGAGYRASLSVSRVDRPWKTTILSAARLVAQKRVDLAILALVHLADDIGLVVAGDGPERERLEDLTRKLGLESRVRFVGWQTGAAKSLLFRAADLFCLPSQYDSFGMVFVEAMAHGVPVVAVSYDAIPDVVIPGVGGILAESYDPQAIASAVKVALARRAELSLSARQLVEGTYAPRIVSGNVLSYLQQVGQDQA